MEAMLSSFLVCPNLWRLPELQIIHPTFFKTEQLKLFQCNLYELSIDQTMFPL